MTLSEMSSTQLTRRTLDDIYDEIIDHMKRSGAFDEIRVDLMDPIWSDPGFKGIIERFQFECEQFCEQVDLNLNRNALRTKLATRFDSYSASGRMLKTHIARLLKERDEDLRSKYYKHAQNYLRKFLPVSCSPDNLSDEHKSDADHDPQHDLQADTDMDIDSSPMEEDDDDDDEIEPERPPFSPIGNDEQISNQNYAPDEETKFSDIEETPTFSANADNNDHTAGQNDNLADCITTMQQKDEPNMTEPSLDEIPIPPEDPERTPQAIDVEHGDPTNSISLEDIPQPPFEGDVNEELTFSSVSSVDTADLSDFENSIKLSDDEANIVGKPKNSKVPVEIIQGHLETTDVKSETEPERVETSEPMGAGESDGFCGESNTTGRRVTRTRKSNPRYSNEHYKLL